jgi:hypothetical protein
VTAASPCGAPRVAQRCIARARRVVHVEAGPGDAAGSDNSSCWLTPSVPRAPRRAAALGPRVSDAVRYDPGPSPAAQARAIDALIRRYVERQEGLRRYSGGGMEHLTSLERETYETLERSIAVLRAHRRAYPFAPGY